MRKVIPGSYGFPLSRMLPELAKTFYYGVLVSLELILQRCETKLVPVLSAAPICSVWETACAPRDRQFARNPSASTAA